MELQEVIKNIDFENIKENHKTIKLEVKNNNWLRRIEIEYIESDCPYDKNGYTYCLKLKDMPFYSYPMINNSYIQTYKSIKRMLNTLFKNVKSNIEVEIGV